MFRAITTSTLLVCSLAYSQLGYSEGFSGNVSAKMSMFKNEAVAENQDDLYSSIAFQPKYTYVWDNNRQIFGIELFARVNESLPSTTDIRELSWIYSADDWEIRGGIRKVFWGVTESQHLVDIINQTDFSESFDGEEKLGQPMLNLAIIQDWGTLDLFVLTGFRERRFPDENARLGFPLPITNGAVKYESDSEDRHIDYAARWSHYIGDWDFGLSYFYGTNREPGFVPSGNSANHVVPIYEIIHQVGFDVQATIENWLWKLEAIYRDGAKDAKSAEHAFLATTAGLEYSFFDIDNTGVDVGLVAEVSYDERGDASTTPFQNDSMFGIRLALNDEQSTDALVGVIYDNDGKGKIFSMEANRRIGEDFKLTLNGYLFTDISSADPLFYSYGNEDFIEFELGYYY